jgi:hypothetical protein
MWRSPLPKPSHLLELKITTTSTVKDPHMVVIPINMEDLQFFKNA